MWGRRKAIGRTNKDEGKDANASILFASTEGMTGYGVTGTQADGQAGDGTKGKGGGERRVFGSSLSSAMPSLYSDSGDLSR